MGKAWDIDAAPDSSGRWHNEYQFPGAHALRLIDLLGAPATGAYKWQFCVTTGHVLGAFAAANGLVAVPAGASIVVVSTSGKQLASYHNPSAALYWGGPSIGDGHVLAGGMDGSLTALAL